jgi:hypothetical protein
MLYSGVGQAAPYPGTSLASLGGPSNPSTAGIYTYAPPGSLFLEPRTDYFIVLTAATPVADGAYEWNYASTWSYSRTDGWNGTYGYTSANGTFWSQNNLPTGFPIFAVNATPQPSVPEPPVINLIVLAGLYLASRRALR